MCPGLLRRSRSCGAPFTNNPREKTHCNRMKNIALMVLTAMVAGLVLSACSSPAPAPAPAPAPMGGYHSGK